MPHSMTLCLAMMASLSYGDLSNESFRPTLFASTRRVMLAVEPAALFIIYANGTFRLPLA